MLGILLFLHLGFAAATRCETIAFPKCGKILLSAGKLSPEVRQHALELCIVEWGDTCGTGIPKGDGVVLTAAHVILGSRADQISLTFTTSGQVQVSMPIWCYEVDQHEQTLGYVYVDMAEIRKIMRTLKEPEAQAAVQEVYDWLQKGVPFGKVDVEEPVYLFGYRPISLEGDPETYYRPTMLQGVAVCLQNNQYEFSPAVEPGMSGGGAINAKGEVVAVIQSFTAGRNFTEATSVDAEEEK